MKIAVIQHRMRSHERMDLAALLALSEQAGEQGVQILVYPRVPGIAGRHGLIDAFLRNVSERAPGMTWIHPGWADHADGVVELHPTVLGRTIVLTEDECIDPELFPKIQEARCDALVWLFSAEDPLQAEAILELAIDASLRLAPLVIVASVNGNERGVVANGISAVASLGEMLAEGGSGEDLLVVEMQPPTGFIEVPRSVSVPATVLLQRLSAHRTHGGHVDPDSLI